MNNLTTAVTIRAADAIWHEAGGWFDARWHFSFDDIATPNYESTNRCKREMPSMNSVDICTRLGLTAVPPDAGTELGVSRSALAGEWPLHGLRHRPEHGTNGWYVWSGQLSEAGGFFVPLHIEHVAAELPAVIPYLALPPGFRFQIGPGYEDVWEDPSLLADATDSHS